VQAEIIAGAIAASATVQTNTITIDPDRLLDLKPARPTARRRIFSARFPDQSGACRPGVAHADLADKTRARILRPQCGLILDSRNLENVLRLDLPPVSSEKSRTARTRNDRNPHLAQPRRPAALSRTP